MRPGLSPDCKLAVHRCDRLGIPKANVHGRSWKVCIRRTLLAVMVIGATHLCSVCSAAQTVSGAVPQCQAKSPGGPLFITAACTDPVLNEPYTDVKRPATITDSSTGLTVKYLYVHGGFTGTQARFAFYFPAAEKYRGRFFETTYPTIGEEEAAPGCPEVGTSACSVVFAISNGAYVVSTNNAGGVVVGGAIAAYRTNAAAAKYSRVLAEQIYGTSASPRGYIYGASGGGYQTVGSMENTSGVWDAAVPMVFGVPNAIPSFMTSQLLALRVLRDKLPQIADAVAPGGSGDPYAGLNAEQRSVLKEVTRLGAPLRGWWQYATMNGGGFWAVEGAVRAMDPSYVDDFWNKPGYEGSESSVRGARLSCEATVMDLAGENELVLSSVPAGDLLNADLIISSGPKAGQSVVITRVTGTKLKVVSTSGITPGTAVRLDNSWLLALQYYSRHQIPTPREYGWDQYLRAGEALYPQRKVLIGLRLNAGSAGSVANGQFSGKMIMVESLLDVLAYPWSADWYRKQAQASLGSKASDNYRLWYMDNADHGPDLSGYTAGVGFEGIPNASDHIVGYLGEVQQALLDLDAWVEKGTVPPASTSYHIDDDNQVQVARTADQRNGVQPVVTLTVAGPRSLRGDKAETPIGRPITFYAKAQTPPMAGKIVKVEWDFEGVGRFTTSKRPIHISPEVSLHENHAFNKPGTYFPVVRVTSQRDGDASTPFGLIQNLASARVVVK